MEELLNQIKKCTLCSDHLELGPNPILTAHKTSKIAIIGQAPGRVVHKSGIPWDDKSGDNLRRWLDIDKDTFYDAKKIALIPMGFCFPGTGKSGDLPPRSECAPKWHQALLDSIENIELTLLIGKYAQNYYLSNKKETLTDTVRRYKSFLPNYFVLPHPSPRNNIWQAKNSWFEENVIPDLRERVRLIL